MGSPVQSTGALLLKRWGVGTWEHCQLPPEELASLWSAMSCRVHFAEDTDLVVTCGFVSVLPRNPTRVLRHGSRPLYPLRRLSISLTLRI